MKCPECGEEFKEKHEPPYATVYICTKCKIILMKLKIDWG